MLNRSIFFSQMKAENMFYLLKLLRPAYHSLNCPYGTKRENWQTLTAHFAALWLLDHNFCIVEVFKSTRKIRFFNWKRGQIYQLCQYWRCGFQNSVTRSQVQLQICPLSLKFDISGFSDAGNMNMAIKILPIYIEGSTGRFFLNSNSVSNTNIVMKTTSGLHSKSISWKF